MKQEYCRKCRKPLTADEIGATKKLVNRGSTVFYCIDCLAEGFDVTREDIERKIAYFKEMGCTCFEARDEGEEEQTQRKLTET